MAADHPELILGDVKACFGMSMATPRNVLSKGQRLPLPICKTLTNQVWMAAGHPKPSLGNLKLCFETSTAKTLQNAGLDGNLPSQRTFWVPEFVFWGVICGCCQFEQECPLTERQSPCFQRLKSCSAMVRCHSDLS